MWVTPESELPTKSSLQLVNRYVIRGYTVFLNLVFKNRTTPIKLIRTQKPSMTTEAKLKFTNNDTSIKLDPKIFSIE